MTDPQDPLAQAPLLRVVHERHPDVDVVVLPPEAPAPDPADAPVPVTDAALDAERSRVEAVAAGLLAAAAPAAPVPAPDAHPAPRTTWRSAPASHVVPVAEVRLPIDGPEAGIAVGRALSASLRADGWDGRLDRAGVTPLLLATLDDRSVRVAWLDDAVLVTVRGRDLPVATATARALVSGAEDAR
ncbi:hypothetical protein [Cellulomonas pakistanensis]|uniref:Uncharacterized protein n=1 Tax=Cellulomonas pakistanensis TaxID=992287 RepID=A0A919U6Q0_9CELL|nr:hypothetical protein [Cellulomonas pakistanensis]GIG36252.1 hypothetical protein Cpa01nite_16330 [Cellulomonas pakistanensis]